MNIYKNNNDYLMHYGVKGMKWGIRHEPENKNYSREQRQRDKDVYGKGGVRRINKAMNRGSSISGARSREAQRIYNARRKAVTGGQIGNTVGAIGGAVGGFLASKYVVNYMEKAFPQYMNEPMARIVVQGAVSAGASSIGKTLGTYGGHSLGMITSGYRPSKFRY